MQPILAPEAPRGATVHPAAGHAYRPDIDGLRALAVLGVVLFHAFPARFAGGFVGVDIFFVISGYLIGSVLMASLAADRFDFRDFYARRVLRIFPALALVLGASLAFGWFGLFADEYRLLGKHVFGGAAFLSNVFLWNEVGYFDTAADTKPLLHLWSLGIEEQFYIVWPLVLLLAWRSRRSLWALCAWGAGLSFLINVAGVHAHPSASFYSPASRVWELLAGSMLAWGQLHRVRLGLMLGQAGAPTRIVELGTGRTRAVLAASGLGLLALGFALVRQERSFPGWWALLPVLGTALLIGAGPHTWINRRLLGQRALVAVGLISYPLYLWHWPLLAFARVIEGSVPGPGYTLALLAVAFLLAWLSWRFVERPLRFGAAPRRRRVGALAAAMALLALGGLAVYASHGVTTRAAVVESAALQKDLILVEDTANAAACKRRYGFDSLYRYCLIDDVARPPTVALLGDSHAYHYVAGQMKFWHARGENLVYWGTRVPFLGINPGTDGYQQATPGMLELALHTPTVKTVVLSMALALYHQDDQKAALVDGLRATLRAFTERGIRVIYVDDSGELPFEPRTCIGRGIVPSSTTRLDCAITRAAFDRTRAANAPFAPVFKEFPQVRVFDPAPVLCDAERCPVRRDGMLVFRDTHHLSYRGDLMVGAAFERWASANGVGRP